jgi:hypothetical protein
MVEFQNEVSSKSRENIFVISCFTLTLALPSREREEDFAAAEAFFSLSPRGS